MLQALARAKRPSPLAYLIPDHHNPTGAVMDAASRRESLRELERARSHVVIDETFVELGLDGIDRAPPAAAGAGARTITIGSLSKSVWGGLRIGWARADPTIVRSLAAARASVDLASPVLEQIVATHVFGALDEIMAERRAMIRVRRQALADALAVRLPGWSYTMPSGGLFLWAQLPGPNSTSLAVRAAEEGVQLTPGPRFGAAGLLERYIRLPFTLAPEQLERAVAILANVATSGAARPAPEPRISYVA
jgi:DNA-binding transcriptional MocR family regulator